MEAIALWESRRGLSFHRYAAEKLTSDEQNPVSEKNIYDVLSRRNGRRPWWCLIEILFDEAPEFAAWVADVNGYEEPRKKLPVEGEALARSYEEKLRSLGEVGERMIREARESARKVEP